MQFYAQTSGTLFTTASAWTPIPNLSITVPEGVNVSAIVILNVPMPYAEGNNFPGGNFGIELNGAVSTVVAGFTYSQQQPQAYGRMPTTLVVAIPLGTKPQTITAVWSGVRGSKVIIDTPATLTALIS
jgi:hypothetical protein